MSVDNAYDRITLVNNEIIIWYFASTAFFIVQILFSVVHLRKEVVKVIAALVSSLNVLLTIYLAFIADNLMIWLAFMISIVSLLNSLRLISFRYKYKETIAQSTKTAIYGLITLQPVVFLWFAIVENIVSVRQIVDLMGFVALAVSIIVLSKMVSTIIHARFKTPTTKKKLRKPTVTLAIPARNETHALSESLRYTVKSDYQKLEILVLDDCSQDDTAQIIKAFAHSGVRFIQGSEPAESWLGKNQAYKTLLEESSGDYIIFAGVDVRFNSSSITQIIDYVTKNELDMASVLPIRNHLDLAATFLQPLRYFWQIALPIKQLPPVLSTCWVVNKNSLIKKGGFEGLRSAIIPESYISRDFKDRYKFLISNRKLGISTRKKLSSQLETATRTIYPMLHRSLFSTLLATLALVWFFIFPYLASFSLIWLEADEGLLVWGLAAILLSLSYILLMFVVFKKTWWIGILSMPVAIFLDSVLLIWSMWQYEFGSVNWKGRNICYPVMKP